MMSKTVFVIDIGSSKTTCLAAIKEDEGLRVISAAAVATRGIHRGRIKEASQVTECVKIALKKVEEHAGAPTGGVVFGVSGLALNSEQSRGLRMIYPAGKPVLQEDLLHANEHSRQFKFQDGYRLLQTYPCEYRLDGRSVGLSPIGKCATRLEVVTHIVSVSTIEANRLADIAAVAGVSLSELVPLPLASGIGLVRPEEAEAECLVIDFGHGTTDGVVFAHGSCVRIASVDVGAQHVTKDIAELIKVTLEDAEALKTASGHTDPEQVGESEVVHVRQIDGDQPRPFPRKVLSEIIESRVKETVTILKNALTAGGYDLGGVQTILITGGGSHLPGLDALLKRVFAAPIIRQGQPRLVGTNSRRSAVPEMSAAVGLALYALEDQDEELAPIAGVTDWRDRIRSLTSIFSAKS